MFSWLHVVVIEIIAMLISSPLQRSCELKQLQFTYFLNYKCTALSGNTQVLLSWLIKEVFLALIPFHVGYPAWNYNTFWQGFMNIHPESKLVSGLYAVSWAKAFVFKSFFIRNEFLLQQEGNLFKTIVNYMFSAVISVFPSSFCILCGVPAVFLF